MGQYSWSFEITKDVDITSGFAQKLWELKDIKQKDSTHVKCVKYGTPISIPCGTICEIVKASYGPYDVTKQMKKIVNMNSIVGGINIKLTYDLFRKTTTEHDLTLIYESVDYDNLDKDVGEYVMLNDKDLYYQVYEECDKNNFTIYKWIQNPLEDKGYFNPVSMITSSMIQSDPSDIRKMEEWISNEEEHVFRFTDDKMISGNTSNTTFDKSSWDDEFGINNQTECQGFTYETNDEITCMEDPYNVTKTLLDESETQYMDDMDDMDDNQTNSFTYGMDGINYNSSEDEDIFENILSNNTDVGGLDSQSSEEDEDGKEDEDEDGQEDEDEDGQEDEDEMMMGFIGMMSFVAITTQKNNFMKNTTQIKCGV